ncbi:MAG TPA: hypothetical protein VF070_49565 [Streptosporangiaceae bacterium]
MRAKDLGAFPASIGVLLGLFGVGAIAGALAAPPVQRLVPPNVILLGALWWWVVQLVALSLAPTVFLLGAVYPVDRRSRVDGEPAEICHPHSCR